MSGQPTIDGITADDLMDLCVETAVVRVKAANLGDLGENEWEIFRLGANDGALSMWEELSARDLIRMRR